MRNLTVVLAFGLGLAGVMTGILWSIVLEGIRLNSGHLSYRMARIPARHYWIQLYAVSVAIFGFAALLRSTHSTKQNSLSAHNNQ